MNPVLLKYCIGSNNNNNKEGALIKISIELEFL